MNVFDFLHACIPSLPVLQAPCSSIKTNEIIIFGRWYQQHSPGKGVDVEREMLSGKDHFSLPRPSPQPTTEPFAFISETQPTQTYLITQRTFSAIPVSVESIRIFS